MIRQIWIPALLLLASLPGIACHSSDNVSWFFVSNPSGDPNFPGSGGGTFIVTKRSTTGPQTSVSGQNEEESAAQVLPRFLDRFLSATRTAVHSRAAVDLEEIILEQAHLALGEPQPAEDRLGSDLPVRDLPIMNLLGRLESLPADSELPAYDQAMRAAASLRMGLAAINLLLSREEPGSPLFDLAPIPAELPSAVALAGDEGAAIRGEFLRATRVQIRAAHADYLAAHAGSELGDAGFMAWVEDFARDISL